MRFALRAAGSLASLGLAVVLAACGGGDDPAETTGPSATSAPETGAPAGEMVVESSDGLATLTLADGSLPDGVSIDDISLDVAFDDSPEEGEPFAAVALAPDGLVLGGSAELAVTMPEPFEGTLMTIHQSGDLIEFMPSDVASVDGEDVITTNVDHFSVMQFYKDTGVLKSTFTLSSSDVVVGETTTGGVAVTPSEAPFSFWLTFPSDGDGRARLIQLSAPREPTAIEVSTLFWDESSSQNWRPSTAPVALTAVASGWEGTGSSTCVDGSRGRHKFGARVQATVAVVSVSEPQSRSMINILRLDGSGPTGTIPQADDSFIPLLDVDSGEEVVAIFTTVSRPRFTCVFGSESESTTSSTSGSETGGEGESDPPEESAFDKLSEKQVTLPMIEVTGDDVCGNAEDLATGGATITARASSTGGRLDIRAADGASGGLTGLLDPTGDGSGTLDDRRTVRNGERDSQELTEVEVGDGTISANLKWRRHDGCETSLFLVFTGIPNDITDWFRGLPAPGPSDCEMVDPVLTDDGENMTLEASLVDRETGEPARNRIVTVTVSGELPIDFLVEDGEILLTMPIPEGERSSVVVTVRKDAHTLGTYFLP